jgi:DNA (cytosine-5)-methyltransferase 1
MKDLIHLHYSQTVITAELLADILSISKATLLKWEKNGKLIPIQNSITHKKEYQIEQLIQFDEIKRMLETN